eukprot:CAMPEP_0177717610 /NCGR_PEP_ID=MMETSP0484_2-20121128/15138_1 /TAXON_ID=354590 /ORGANISM="Rhodomonas lens, Strain RHODO" /LENGTH=503 /DNA_ID=CAMNT_0019229725 /DNA_START=236 /DNA_END=1744 /DNA_ORIENTATION=+
MESTDLDNPKEKAPSPAMNVSIAAKNGITGSVNGDRPAPAKDGEGDAKDTSLQRGTEKEVEKVEKVETEGEKRENTQPLPFRRLKDKWSRMQHSHDVSVPNPSSSPPTPLKPVPEIKEPRKPQGQISPCTAAERHENNKQDDDEDRASIVSLDSDSTNGPFFWYRVVSKFVPKPRNCHTATMVGDKMLVFGGFGGSKWFEELWTFDTRNIEWHQPELQRTVFGASHPCPPARYAHSCVSFRGLLYVFGGYGGADSWLGDLWVLDTQSIRVRDQTKAIMSWSKPDTVGEAPSPRAAHTANVVGSRIFIFGGNDGTVRMNDLYSLDTQNMEWKREICAGELPAPRAGHTMTLLPAESATEDSNPKLLLFAGGDVTCVFNDVHVLDMESLRWSAQPTSGPRPSARAGHCACTLPGGDLLVWGGGSVGKVMNDLHVLNVGTMTWSGEVHLKMSPEPRVGHSVCMWGTEMYVFGGGDSNTVFGDLTILDTEALMQHGGGCGRNHVTPQ